MLLQLLIAFHFTAAADVIPEALAHREPEVSYREYLEKAKLTRDVLARSTPIDVQVPVDQIDTSKIVAWDSLEQTAEAFTRARDLRFLYTKDRPKFSRRSSWLYPDDGCYDRASLANSNLKQWNYPVPSKLFVFGDLIVKTSNHPDGFVTWWYHVVPVVRVGEQVYVIDPAIDPEAPLPLMNWLKSMTRDGDVSELQVAVCSSGTYIPQSDCMKELAQYDKQAADDQLRFLRAEWERLTDLGRDPMNELGENPPWRGGVVSPLLEVGQ